MKIEVRDEQNKVHSSIADIAPVSWERYESAALKLMADQTDDPRLASMMLLTAFMKNVSGEAADSIFLTGIPNELSEAFDNLLTEVGQGKAGEFLARLIAMSGQGALHIINNRLEGDRMGHNIIFLGIPPETMERWVELAEMAELPTGDLLARVFIAGPSGDDEQKQKFRDLQAQKRKEAEKEKGREQATRSARGSEAPPRRKTERR